MTYILRRKKLGKTSCEAIVNLSKREIKIYRNDAELPTDENELCIRWGCTSNVSSKKVLNKSSAIHLVSNKTQFRRLCQETENIVPKTWFSKEGVKFPVVVRPETHHQGRSFYFCENFQQLDAAINKCQDNYYISEYIDKEKEFRVFFVQGLVVCVANKKPADSSQKAWNVFQGGAFENIRWKSWPLEAIRVAKIAFDISGLDFAGVDVMMKNEKAYVLEINSAPSLTSLYRQQCFAKAFDYIVENGKEHLNINEEYKKSYLRFIHPAVKEISD